MAEVDPKEIDRETLRTMVRRGAQLVEVLPREEYDRVHLAGAISIPLELISRHTADRLLWERPVIVYSAGCLDDLSARAAWRLSTLGFTQVYRYTAGKADWLANGFPVEGAQARASGAGDFADLDVPTCARSDRVGEVRARVNKEGWDTCVVVNQKLVVLGILRANDLEKADQTWTAEEAMERAPQTFRLDASLDDVADYMQTRRVDSALVTTPDGNLFGLLKLEDVEKALMASTS